jgi:hypothetical protein
MDYPLPILRNYSAGLTGTLHVIHRGVGSGVSKTFGGWGLMARIEPN